MFFLETRNIESAIKNCTNIKELLILKEDINRMMDNQIKKIEDNQELIIQIRYASYSGKFIVERGIKAEYIINRFFGKPELLEEVECKRQGTKKYNNILEQLKNKYNPEIISA